jgi:putative ABC transport system substrate-binding protein
MSKRNFVFALGAIFLTLSFPVEAQQAKKVPRIGYLGVAPISALSERIEPFRQSLRELGYVEGKNIFIERRSAEGKPDRMPTLAAELVQLKVDVIVTAGSNATRPAKAATATIPIVMAQDDDPVVNGFVASLAQPGGNITGLSQLSPEISGKRLELIREIVPKLSRVAIFGTSTSAANAKSLEDLQAAAAVMKVQLQYIDVLNPKQIETAFRAAAKERADAVLWLVSGSISRPQRTQIIELAVKSRLPAIYAQAAFVEAGGFVSYGVNFTDLDRRAAIYVDKILKGAKPADLPVEQPMKFELIVNLKTAKQIGLTIPPNVLARADRVIR